MKIKILKPIELYKTRVGEEFEVLQYNITDFHTYFKIKGQCVDDTYSVITELPKSFCVKRCDNKEKWDKYLNWLNIIYDKNLTGDVSRYYGANIKGECDSNETFGTEIHIDDIIKHIEYMKNKVIKVLNREHGIKVIEYWKSLGVNTTGYPGSLCEDEGDSYIYYGIINGMFSNFSLDSVEDNNAEIIELPINKMQVGKWYLINNGSHGDFSHILVSDITRKTVSLNIRYNKISYSHILKDGEVISCDGYMANTEWENSAVEVDEKDLPIKEEFDMTTNEGRLAYAEKHYPIGTVIKSIHTGDEVELNGEPLKYGISNIMSYIKFNNGNDFNFDIYYKGKWAEIIKKEENKVMETQRLSRAGLKEIHSVACPTWKGKLEKMGIRNSLEDYIELTQEEVDAMFKACTKEQLPIVSKYLKQDDVSVDVTKFVAKNKGILDDNKSSYIIRDREMGKYRKKSFLLSQWYDWEIKEDELGFLCLIPTKKK
jgi:hypothetical protein